MAETVQEEIQRGMTHDHWMALMGIVNRGMIRYPVMGAEVFRLAQANPGSLLTDEQLTVTAFTFHEFDPSLADTVEPHSIV